MLNDVLFRYKLLHFYILFMMSLYVNFQGWIITSRVGQWLSTQPLLLNFGKYGVLIST